MKTGGHHGQKVLSSRFSVTPAEKSGRNFCQMKKVGLFMSFQLTPPPLNFFGGRPWKKILFFLFKVSTYVFGIGIIFLLTLLQILIWGKKVLTLCQKMHFFWQNNTFSFRNCKKKRFRLRFLKTMHILFLFTSLGQLRQHRSYFVHFQPSKTKDILSFWVFLTFFSSLRWNPQIHNCFPGMGWSTRWHLERSILVVL